MTDVMDNYNEFSKTNLIDTVVAQDKDAFMQAFNDVMSQKVIDALEIKKVEVASNLITPQETDEIQTIETEVDGSIDGSIDDLAATEEASQES